MSTLREFLNTPVGPSKEERARRIDEAKKTILTVPFLKNLSGLGFALAILPIAMFLLWFSVLILRASWIALLSLF
jgi:hypothetical protein